MGVPQDGRSVVVAVRVERCPEGGVVVRVEASAAAPAAAGTVVDGAEGGVGEGGEDPGVPGDGGADALAAAETGSDQVKRVLAVHLRAGGAPSSAAVVAAD